MTEQFMKDIAEMFANHLKEVQKLQEEHNKRIIAEFENTHEEVKKAIEFENGWEVE